MAKKKKSTGYVRMVELGMKAVRVYLDPQELRAVEAAAKEANMPLGTYVRRAAFEMAIRRRFRVTRHGFQDYGPGS